VIEAVGFLPKEMSADYVQAIHRMAKSVIPTNAASGSRRGDIVLYDNAFEPNRNLSQVIAHEIAHQLYNKLSPEDLASYLDSADWMDANTLLAGEPAYILTRKKSLTPDSAHSVAEDFSNNIEYFLFNPDKTKQEIPRVYQWITDRFGDKFKSGKGSP
jgi:Mlc titration factor MtfA (ptsG expression regulator)